MYELATSVIRSTVVLGAVIALLTRLVQLVVSRMRGRVVDYATGWRATLWWALGFGGIGFATFSSMPFGIVVLAAAIGTCGLAAWRGRSIPEGTIGAVLGTGGLCLFIGLTKYGLPPCPTGSATSTVVGSWDCGGFNSTTWVPLVLGLTLTVSLIAFGFRIRYHHETSEVR